MVHSYGHWRRPQSSLDLSCLTSVAFPHVITGLSERSQWTSYTVTWSVSCLAPQWAESLHWTSKYRQISTWTFLCVCFGHIKTALYKKFEGKTPVPAVTLGQAQLSILTCQLERWKMMGNREKKFNLCALERGSAKGQPLHVQYGVERKIWSSGKN
jgi:hypothetical protein